jgi:hypothetical protein
MRSCLWPKDAITELESSRLRDNDLGPVKLKAVDYVSKITLSGLLVIYKKINDCHDDW